VVPPAFSAALRRRADLLAGTDTDAVRLLDASGDGPEFAGLILEDYAGRWLVQTDDRFIASPPLWLREVRPAPRAIYWKRLEKSDRKAPVYWHGETVEAPFEIREYGIVYRIDFAAGYSQGIFLDQRSNRRQVHVQATTDARTVLNLFSYTCAFSVAAAMGGARTTSVDLSKRYLEWGRENFRANQIDLFEHEFYAGDVFDRLGLFAKKKRRFDLVIVDPPTFSRNRAGKIFRVDRDYRELATLAASLVSEPGCLVCSTNHRGFPRGELRLVLASALGSPWRLENVAMPPDFTGDQYLQSVWAKRSA
jgi:23S rRNA (cytosine1962-C5)-methyltransferase